MTLKELIDYLEEIRAANGDDLPCKITSPFDLFDYPLTRKEIQADSVEVTFIAPEPSVKKSMF